MKQKRLLLASLLAVSPPALAQNVSDLSETDIAARTLALSEILRCVICDDRSIAESDSDFANGIREMVEERIRLGDSDEDIRKYMHDRYGDAIFMQKDSPRWSKR